MPDLLGSGSGATPSASPSPSGIADTPFVVRDVPGDTGLSWCPSSCRRLRKATDVVSVPLLVLLLGVRLVVAADPTTDNAAWAWGENC